MLNTFLICLLLSVSWAQGNKEMTPLKKAFQSSRAENNIDLVLPVFLSSDLYVIVAETLPGKTGFFLSSSPDPERSCVTVSEKEEWLSSVKWPKRKIKGLDLIKELTPAIEIVVVYNDGGDYITREHLEWYREQIPQPKNSTDR